MSLDIDLIENACPHCKRSDTVYSCNYTHNIIPMARAVGVYKIMWRPEDVKGLTAEKMIEPLEKAISKLSCNPEKYDKMNPSNGWGSRSSFVKFLEELQAACRANPTATVRADR